MKIKFKPAIAFIVVLVVLFFISVGVFKLLKEKRPVLPLEKISQLLNIIEMDRDSEKIKNAVITLGNYEVSDEKVLKTLKKIAKNNKDEEIRKESIFSLAFIQKDEILPFFEDLLKTEKDTKARKYVLLALKHIHTRRAKNTLFSVIENDKDFEVRSTAAYILGQKRDKKYSRKFIKYLEFVIPQNLAKESVHLIALVDILNNFLNEFSANDIHKKYISDKTSVSNDIKMIEEFLIHLRDKKIIKLKERAFIALERIKLFDALLANVLAQEKDINVVKSADNASVVIGKIETLINKFIKSSEAQEERMILSAIALGEMKSKKAIPHLISILKDTENTWLKREIFVALGNIGDYSAMDVLIDELDKEKHSDFEEDVIVSLGQIGGKKAESALLKVLGSDKNRWVRIKALESLKNMKSKTMINDLCVILEKEDDIEVQLAIISLFKSCKSEKAKEELKRIFFNSSKEAELRLNALRTYLESDYISRRDKIVLKNEIAGKLTEDMFDEEKIFILEVIDELKIMEALPKVKTLINSKNTKLRLKASEVFNILNKKN